LKLENLLLADAQDLSSVRIADFGLAKSAFSGGGGGDRLGAGGICGTPSYLAPEIVAGQRYTPAVDCWAAGVCLYILLSGVVPFNWTDRPGADLRELFDRISAGAFSLDGVQWDGVSDDAKDLVRGLMCTSVPQRLTAKRALSHRWFTAQLASATPLAHLPAAQAKLRAFADALAKDPVIQTEMLSVRHQLKSTSQSDGQGKGLIAPRSARRGAAGPGTLFCGMDHFVVEVSHGLQSWSNGVARWTNDALHGRF
jgi:serine/threonine protein kinase